jgi:hypothetical protein
MKVFATYPPIMFTNHRGQTYVVGEKWHPVPSDFDKADIEWVRRYPEPLNLTDTYIAKTLKSCNTMGSVVKTVTGSRGETYTIKRNNGVLNCTCKGFVFRGKCKHTL